MATPDLITPDTLKHLTTDGICAAERLESGYTSDEARIAEARIASNIAREAAKHGLAIDGRTITYTAESESAGLFGKEDPYQRVWLTGTWLLDLGPAPAAVLQNGPAAGTQLAVAAHKVFRPILIDQNRGHAYGNTIDVRRIQYDLAGYQPDTRTLIYRT